MALAMPCKIIRSNKNCGSGASNKFKTKFACILEACESSRLRMGESLTNHHEDHIAGKGNTLLQHYNLVHKFIPMPQSMKIPAAKAAVDKEWETLEKISAWNLTKVRSKKQVIDEARTSGATVHFASSMDICHLKNAELEAKHQKYKGRVVAAKVMDIISRLPGCARQAADAVPAYTQVKMEVDPKIIGNSRVGMSRHMDSVYHDTNGQNHGPVWKTQSFLLSEICTVILWQYCYGKGKLRKSCCNMVGRRFPIGNAYSYTVKKDYSDLCMWMTSNWLKRNKTLIQCGKYETKKLISENQHLSLIMYTWAALKDNAK